jgi:hypothetical protein
MNCFFISGRFLVQSLGLSRLFDAFSKRSPPAQLTALLIAFGSPNHSLPNSSASETPALLRLDRMFDPLRNDPRFQKLCEEKPQTLDK